MTHEQRLGININWLINHRFNVTRKHSRYEDLTKIATWLRLWLSMKAGWSRYLGVSQYQGWLASRHLLVTSSAKTLHLPSAVGPSSQGRRGSTREILGLDLFYRAEGSYFAVLMYWQFDSHTRTGRMRASLNLVIIVLLGEDVLLAAAIKSPHLGSKLANSSIGLAI